MASNKCLMCEHYKKVYMPYIRKFTMECDIEDTHSTGCKTEYKPKGENKK